MSLCALFFFLAGACQLLGVSGKNISFADCGSKVGKIVSIDISPCKVEPCTFYKGENATCTIMFIPREDLSSAVIQAFGIISDVKVPWKSWSLCNLTKCPVKNAQETKIVLSLVVSPEYPTIKLVVDIEMKDQTKQMVFCAKFSAEIKNKGLRAMEQDSELGKDKKA
ncbi:NPC intracellular cholesterol transporter 2-like [Actinia tenebrosa]|uniref:NPC intracellular cholesterol transporter 2-like n=1 Tax=Actinia tenebrosa TaxID=6105 RepID=A0A6P8HY00_ACTTE|nr:NPC intracellular cholesterol transporter 2-like [Actinia tenebrosa]